MPGNAKVFARVFDYSSTPNMQDGAISFTVEWKRITGGRQGGKQKFTVIASSDSNIRADLREMLAQHLSAKFAPEIFKPRDIVGTTI